MIDNSNTSSNILNLLTAGHYYVHIFLENLSSLDPPHDKPMDVILRVSLFGESKETFQKNNVSRSSEIFYGDHLHFESEVKIKEMLQKEYLLIEAIDTGVFSSLVGSTRIPLAPIYFEKDHCIKHRWMILFNNDVDISKPAGFVKASISLTKENDKMPALLPQTPEDRLTGESALQMKIPPQFKMVKRFIKVSVYYLHKLAVMDSSFFNGTDKSDPYLDFKLGPDSVITPALKGLTNTDIPYPVGHQINLVYVTPSCIDQLAICLMDWDRYGKNEYFGTAYVSLNEIIQGKYSRPFWVYFYGGQTNAESEEVKTAMNTLPQIASRFKGSAYLKIENLDKLQFDAPSEPLKIQDPDQKLPAKMKFTFAARIFYVINICYIEASRKDNHQIMMNWGGFEIFSKAVRFNNQILQFFEFISQTVEFYIKDRSNWESEEKYWLDVVGSLPDIIISIYNQKKKKSVSFIRLKPLQFFGEYMHNRDAGSECISEKTISLNLKIDDSYKLLLPESPGMLTFKAKLYSETSSGPSFNISSSSPSIKRIKICTNAFQAKGIPASDENALSDPILMMNHFGEELKTESIKCSLNPIWNYRRIIETTTFQFDNEWLIPPLVVKIYDEDLGGFLSKTSYDYLGGCIVQIKAKISQNLFEKKHPRWIPLRYVDGANVGRLLFSYSIHEPNISVPKILPPLCNNEDLHEYLLKIRIVGLRNLQSSSLFAVSYPKITLDTSSLKKAGGNGDYLTKLTSVSKSGGSNPTFAEIINLEVTLQKDDDLKPSIMCTVTDSSFYGISSTLVGTFEIDLERTSFLTKLKIAKMLTTLKQLCSNPNSNKKSKVSQIERVYQRVFFEIEERLRAEDPITFLNKYSLLFKDFTGEQKDLNRELIKKIGKIIAEQSNQISTLDSGIFKGSVVQEKQFDDNEALLDNIPEQEAGPDEDHLGLPVVIIPVYEKSYLENPGSGPQALEEQPNPVLEANRNIYERLGHDTLDKQGQMHYRLRLDIPLEESEVFYTTTMEPNLSIKRGKAINQEDQGFYFKHLQKTEPQRIAGTFKGATMLIEKGLFKEIEGLGLGPEISKLGFPCSQSNWNNYEIEHDLMIENKVKIVIYVIRVTTSENKDTNSKNDCYLTLSIGDTHIKDSANMIQDDNSPEFRSRFEIEHVFPGPSSIKLQVWDQDIAFDDIIGEVDIDLEDRFFNPRFKSLTNIPIERRSLVDPKTKQTVGDILLWTEIYKKSLLDKNPKLMKTWDISLVPPQKMQLRVVIWQVENAPISDFEGTSDLAVRVIFAMDRSSPKITDTHYRSQSGFGSFNWRMIFPVVVKETILKIGERDNLAIEFQVIDKDLFKSNDFLSSARLDLYELFEAVQKQGLRKLYSPDGKYRRGKRPPDRFVIEARNNDSKGGKCKLTISVELVPENDCKKSIVGEGRDQPNQDPHLPEPVGRFEWSWNPIKLLNQTVGAGMRFKVCCCCCCILLVYLIILLLPIYSGLFLSDIVFGIIR